MHGLFKDWNNQIHEFRVGLKSKRKTLFLAFIVCGGSKKKQKIMYKSAKNSGKEEKNNCDSHMQKKLFYIAA